MKKIYGLICLVVLMTVSLSSCSLFSFKKIEKISTLVQEQIKVTKAFTEQIQSVLTEQPDKQEKIDAFEQSIDQMLKSYYEYYKDKGEAGLEQARTEITEFLGKLDADGVGLTKDSIPYYLERFEKLVKPKP